MFKQRIWIQSSLALILALGSLAGLPTQAHAGKPVHDAYRSGESGLAELARLRKEYNSTRARVSLPKDFELDWRRGDFERAFQLSTEFWKQGFRIQEFREMIDGIADGSVPFEKEDGLFKSVRDRFKYLRFAFVAFSRDHEFPEQIDRITTQMGGLRDAMLNDQAEEAHTLALKISKLLDDGSTKKMEKEVRKFRPAKAKSFYKWVHQELTTLDDGLDASKLTAHDFHALRKVAAGLRVVLQTILSTRSDSGQEAVLSFVGDLNDRMGDFHNELVKSATEGSIDYDKTPISLPAAIRSKATALVRALSERLPE